MMSMCQFDTGANTLLCWICGRHSIRDQKKGVRRSRKRNKCGFIYKSKSCWICFRQIMWALVDVREAQSWDRKMFQTLLLQVTVHCFTFFTSHCFPLAWAALFENIYLCTSFRDILQHHHKTFHFFPPFSCQTHKSPSIPKHTFFSRFNFEVWEIFLIEAQNVKMVSYLSWPCLPRQGYCV
jgi:hypothetical protein